MRYLQVAVVIILQGFFLPTADVWAGKEKDNQIQQRPQSGWTTFSRGGAIYQFDTDLDDGGSYSASRVNIQAGQGYAWNPQTSISLALSYSNDNYSFEKDDGFGISALAPWDTVHTVSVSMPMRFKAADDWSAFFIPSVRSTGESSAEFSETLTGGAFTGFAYRFGSRLSLGPGIGVISQLEDSASVFPVLIVNWKITDKISLETGRGLAATLGPGLTLNYSANQQWNFAIGGRYEKLRFRLDKQGKIPNGIGEDTAVPLFINCTYRFNQKAALSFVGGVELEGELKAEDADGNRIDRESSDPTLFGGVTFNLRL